ncbi:hypothetical protein V8C44DRAFT_228389 [Trichoderma aethiopicum]
MGSCQCLLWRSLSPSWRVPAAGEWGSGSCCSCRVLVGEPAALTSRGLMPPPPLTSPPGRPCPDFLSTSTGLACSMTAMTTARCDAVRSMMLPVAGGMKPHRDRLPRNRLRRANPSCWLRDRGGSLAKFTLTPLLAMTVFCPRRCYAITMNTHSCNAVAIVRFLCFDGLPLTLVHHWFSSSLSIVLLSAITSFVAHGSGAALDGGMGIGLLFLPFSFRSTKQPAFSASSIRFFVFPLWGKCIIINSGPPDWILFARTVGRQARLGLAIMRAWAHTRAE